MASHASIVIGTDAFTPWDYRMNVGSGFNVEQMQVAKTAFSTFEIDAASESPHRDVHVYCQVIDDEISFRLATGLLADDFGSVCQAGETSIVKFLKKIECNRNNFAVLFRIVDSREPQLYKSEPVLTGPAQDCLKGQGVGAFTDRYGSHFIAGLVRRSTFDVMMQVHSENSKGSGRLVESVEERMDLGVVSTYLSGIFEKLQGSVADMNFAISSTGSTPMQFKLNTTTDEVMLSLNAWKDSDAPLPHLAILKHYSLVLDEVPHPATSWKTRTDIVDAYQDLLLLQMKVRSEGRIPQMDSMQLDLYHLEKRLARVEATDNDKYTLLEEWRKQFGNNMLLYNALYHPVAKRRDLLAVVQASQKNNAWALNTKFYPGKSPEFRTGITSPGHFHPFESEIAVYKWWFSKDRDSDTNGIVQKEICQFGVHGDRIIVGIEAISEREDHHNNGWFRVLKGGVGTSLVEILFETSHWRASEWSVSIWHVERSVWEL